MKTVLTLLALTALIASAATGPYMLVLVTVTEHFETQLVTFDTLRECTDEGARRMVDQDQDLYLGFGCVTEDRLPQ